jgi:hypothetical protein
MNCPYVIPLAPFPKGGIKELRFFLFYEGGLLSLAVDVIIPQEQKRGNIPVRGEPFGFAQDRLVEP